MVLWISSDILVLSSYLEYTEYEYRVENAEAYLFLVSFLQSRKRFILMLMQRACNGWMTFSSCLFNMFVQSYTVLVWMWRLGWFWLHIMLFCTRHNIIIFFFTYFMDILLFFSWSIFSQKQVHSQIKWKTHHMTTWLAEWTSYLSWGEKGTGTTEYGYYGWFSTVCGYFFCFNHRPIVYIVLDCCYRHFFFVLVYFCSFTFSLVRVSVHC